MEKAPAVICAVAALLLAGGVDFWTRWGRKHSAAVVAGAEATVRLPDRIGVWEGKEVALDELIVRVAGCAAYKSFRYTNATTARSADVTVMVGLPGQMAEHTPEVCMPAGGFTFDRKSFTLRPLSALTDGAVGGELAAMDFIHPGSGQSVRVWHGWFDGKSWSRPKQPRLAYFAAPVLFRLQLSSTLVNDPFSDDKDKLVDSCEEFLRDALPTLTELFKQP